MVDVWTISDTHFGHENIIKYCNRPFNDATEMDLAMLDAWNSVVAPTDKVYHLGDVFFGRGAGEYILPKLHGKKRLILGNHDNGKDQLLIKHFQKIDVWRMFTEYNLLLTHVPVHPSSLEGTNRQGQPKELINVHGHIHQNKPPPGKYLCVCVEQTNYKPVHIEDLYQQWRRNVQMG